MGYTPVSVPKSGANPGRPKGKDSNIIIFRMDDVLNFPNRDANGVQSEVGQNLTFKAGFSAIAVYATPSSIKRYDTGEGDPDAKGWLQNLEFEHPGDELAFEEWKENNINENLGACSFRRGFTNAKIHGTIEEPLQFEVEEQDDKDGLKTTVKLKSVMRGPKSMIYQGEKPTLDTDSGGGAGV
ncbi:MAG: hypothetical protein ACK5JD_06285 [Mangrovibacterium sp.]